MFQTRFFAINYVFEHGIINCQFICQTERNGTDDVVVVVVVVVVEAVLSEERIFAMLLESKNFGKCYRQTRFMLVLHNRNIRLCSHQKRGYMYICPGFRLYNLNEMNSIVVCV